MKRIVVLSNLDEQCGNATYGRVLTKYLSQWYNVQMLSHALYPVHHGNPDVVIVNWHPARVNIDTTLVHHYQSQGAKVILILQNSFEGDSPYGPGDLVCESDAVVAHEPMMFVAQGHDKPVNFHFIPHAVLEVDNLHKWNGSIAPMVGTAGFQFPWKRTDVAVKAAKSINIPIRIFCPPYPGFDRNRVIDQWQQLYNNVHVDRNWLSEEQVVQALSEHVMNIFWFQSQDVHDQFGQSGAVRLGLAAGRPTIISRHRKFRTLFPYEDELYIAETEEDVYRHSRVIFDNPFAAKRPNRLLKEMGWPAVAEKYRALVESLL